MPKKHPPPPPPAESAQLSAEQFTALGKTLHEVRASVSRQHALHRSSRNPDDAERTPQRSAQEMWRQEEAEEEYEHLAEMRTQKSAASTARRQAPDASLLSAFSRASVDTHEQLVRDFLTCFADPTQYALVDPNSGPLCEILQRKCRARSAYAEMEAICALLTTSSGSAFAGTASTAFECHAVYQSNSPSACSAYKLITCTETLLTAWRSLADPSYFSWDQTVCVFTAAAMLREGERVAGEDAVIMLCYYLSRMDAAMQQAGGWNAFIRRYGGEAQHMAVY